MKSHNSSTVCRVYDSPVLTYRDLNKNDTDPNRNMAFNIPRPGGKWDMKRNAARGSRPSFVDNKHLNNWAILDLANTQQAALDHFVDQLYEEGNSIGYNVEFPLEGHFRADNRNLAHVLEEFRRLCDILLRRERDAGPPLIVVITPGKDALLYNGLKHEGDVLQRISTQVILRKNVINVKPATLHNILLKINSKLGGTNQTLDRSNSPHILSQPVMIMGADVTHAAADQVKPSIAAVVASMDPKASQYECEVRFQVSHLGTSLFNWRSD